MEGSHDYKATVAAFESFPRDELFQAPDRGAARRDRRGRARRGGPARDADGAARRGQPQHHGAWSRCRAIACPRSCACACRSCSRSASTPNRSEYHLALVEGAAAQLFFLLHVPEGEAPDVPLAELEQEVARLARTWDDRLADALVARYGDAEGRRLAALYSAPTARLLQDLHPPRPRARRHRAARARRAGEAFAVGLQNEQPRADAGGRAAADAGRRSRRPAARSRSASSCPCSRRSA